LPSGEPIDLFVRGSDSFEPVFSVAITLLMDGYYLAGANAAPRREERHTVDKAYHIFGRSSVSASPMQYTRNI